MTVIYFIQAGKDGPIKVGRAVNVQKRLSSLQSGHHETLHLLAWIDRALESLEGVLHKRFAAGRIRGEWFKPDTPGLKELIACVLRDRIPAWALKHVLPSKDPILAAVRAIDADEATEWCKRCGYAIEGELVERGSRVCFRCMDDLSKVAA